MNLSLQRQGRVSPPRNPDNAEGAYFRAIASSPFLSVKLVRFVGRKLGRAEAARTRERMAKTEHFTFGRNQAVYAGKECGPGRTLGHRC